MKLITEPRTKESRGFAFVMMNSNAAVEESISKLDKIELDGRVITVEKATIQAIAASQQFSTVQQPTRTNILFHHVHKLSTSKKSSH